jgi:hypothetical protein
MSSSGVSVTDSRNGITTPRLNLLAAVDTSAPAVSLTTPTPGTIVGGAVMVISNASDNIGVSRVEFYLDGVLKSTGTTAPYSFIWDTATAANGSHTLSAKAYDAVGNVGQSGNDIVTVFNDATAPTVSLSAPAPGSTVSGIVTVTASAADNVGVNMVEFYLDGILKSTSMAVPYSFSWDTSATAYGSHIISAKAYDAAGNVGQSGDVTVTVTAGTGQAEPVPALSPWGVLAAAVALAGIAGAGKYRHRACLHQD